MSVRDRLTIFFPGTRVEIFRPSSSPRSSPEANSSDMRRNRVLMENPAVSTKRNIQNAQQKNALDVSITILYFILFF